MILSDSQDVPLVTARTATASVSREAMLRAYARGRHTAIIRELEIPVPFDLGQFVAGLERQRSRPIRLRPFNSEPGCPCGLWIGTAKADYIYHEAGTTPFHATHIALHEIAHMLLGHGDARTWDQFVSLLAPDVDGALIQLILGRSAYSSAEERDAETLASLILCGATRPQSTSTRVRKVA